MAAYTYLQHESMDTVMTWVNLVLFAKFNVYKKKYPSMNDAKIAKILNCGKYNTELIFLFSAF